MKTTSASRHFPQAGNALLITLIVTGAALATLAGIMSWSSTTFKLADRYNQYNRAVAAAEAVTEKVLGRMSADYQNGGDSLVTANLASYQQTSLTSTDSTYWADWQFSDANGNTGQTFVQGSAASNYTVLNSTYAGLKGFVSTYTLVSNARQPNALQDVTGGVFQQLQLARIPIFQFAMYSSGDMEIGNGQPFVITGRVHSNQQLYIEPISSLTFQSDVTAVGDILYQRSPLDSRIPPYGAVVYQGQKKSHVPALTLPIGTTNTPTAVREIIELPPAGEDPASPMGHQRYCNLTDMLVVVTDSAVSASSGGFNSFGTAIPVAEVNLFVSTNASFYDTREAKTVRPIDINIGVLKAWSGTNNDLRMVLGSRDVSSIYVADRRTPASTILKAVRVFNGQQLPSRGLTVATADPLYVFGHYNQSSSANLGTANTSTSLPASFAADAITILSPHWVDTNSQATLSARVAAPTTVNAAILAGEVETTTAAYSGGMENFPRFLESWGAANIITYNGSMVKLFPSLYATNVWGKSGVYDPPARNWSYDINFDDPTKLPPVTPGLVKTIRSQWATVAPNQTTAPASSF